MDLDSRISRPPKKAEKAVYFSVTGALDLKLKTDFDRFQGCYIRICRILLPWAVRETSLAPQPSQEEALGELVRPCEPSAMGNRYHLT